MQTVKEEYTPIINTLLTYILFDRSIDRSRWESVQREYHHTMNGKPSYIAWHKNRPELYKIMDTELKLDGRSNTVNNFEDNDSNDISAVYRRNQRQQPRQQQQKQRFQPGWNPPQVRRPQSQQQQFNQNRRSSPADIKRRLQSMLCRHCSKWAGENRYHIGPKGGDVHSNCPYDQQGNIRPNKRFVSRIGGKAVNEVEIEDFRSAEDDLEFIEPDVNQVEYTTEIEEKPFCT